MSRNSSKRSGVTLNLNALKFPPGFFDETQFRSVGSRVMSRRNQSRSSNDLPYEIQEKLPEVSDKNNQAKLVESLERE